MDYSGNTIIALLKPNTIFSHMREKVFGSEPVLASVIRILLLGATLWQEVYGIMQLLGFRHSLHHLYPVTGSFYNPGPFGCFLSLTFPLALAEALHGRPLLRYLAMAVILLDAILLPMSLSRTAWIAAALGSIIIFLPEITTLFRRRKILLPLSILALILLSSSLFYLKANSSHGRLLMWKVAITAVDSRPFSGVGPECVAGAYGEAQERYFSLPDHTHTPSQAAAQRLQKEILVADAPDFVFNEYLQTAIAHGWGVALLLILLLLSAFLTAFSCRNLPIAGCVVAAMTVMMASYPFQFPLSSAVIALILVTAFLSTTMIDIRIIGSVAAMTLLLILCQPVDRMEINQTFGIGLSLHKAGKWERSNKVLMEFLPHTADPMPLNIIGKNWQQLGHPDSAAYYLNRAATRCPNRLYPHYLLMKLYADSASFSPSKALREASILLNMNIKVSSPATDDMRGEARLLINNLTDETNLKDK